MLSLVWDACWAAMLRLPSYDLWSGVAEMAVGGLVDFWMLLWLILLCFTLRVGG